MNEVLIKYIGDTEVTNITTETRWQPMEIKKVAPEVASELIKDNKFQVVEEKEKPKRHGRKRSK